MSPYKIFPAFAAQYPVLIEVWERSVRETHHFLAEADIQYYKPLILEQYFDQVQLFYVRVDQQVLGFIGIAGQMVQMLFVDPIARGRGVGKSLMLFAIDHYSVNNVDVNEQNQQAVGFYQHLGFEVKERFEYDAAGKPFPILSMMLPASFTKPF